jgi:TetR/AcrR family transcriptional repressor of nem operon
MARHRNFNDRDVLSKITLLFWERGFHSTSVDDILRITRLQKGSLYSCFGNKEKLFRLALDHYLEDGFFAFRTNESAMETLRKYFALMISEAALPKSKRRGCLVFNSCLEFGHRPSRLHRSVLEKAKEVEGYFRILIEEAANNGEISAKINKRKAAQRLFVAAFTIRQMLKFMPKKDLLREIANGALEAAGSRQPLRARSKLQ